MNKEQRQAKVIASLQTALAELDDMKLNMPAIWVAQALATLRNEPRAGERSGGVDSSVLEFDGEQLTDSANKHIQKQTLDDG